MYVNVIAAAYPLVILNVDVVSMTHGEPVPPEAIVVVI
jgi:hypothetical protein